MNVVVNTLRSNPVQAERGKKTKLMSWLDSMHTFISRTIIIVIPLSMRQSYAVVVIVIVIVIVIGIVSSNVLQKSYSITTVLVRYSRGDQYYYG